MPQTQGASGHEGPDEAISILRRLDAGRGEFVTYKSLIGILLAVLGAYGALGGWFISTKLDSINDRVGLTVERKFVEIDQRLLALENRLAASIDGGFDRLHARLGETSPPPEASIVEWKPIDGLDLPPDFAALAEAVSPVGIYTMSPDFWRVSAEDADDKLNALKLLIGDGGR